MDNSIMQATGAVEFASLRYVSLRLLWDCNLRCVMCDHPHRKKNEMSPDTAHKVLDQLSHPVRITFIGGEPCLWLLRFPEVLRRAINEGHVVHLITNGTLIARLTDFVDAFRDRSVSVQFSIDGIERNYEQIRKRSNWNVLVDAIRLLNARRAEGDNKNAVITANYLLMQRTLADLPEFVRFCAREKIDAISEITEAESVYHHQQETNAAIRLAIKVAQNEGISLSFPPFLGDLSLSGKQWSGPPVASVAPGKSFLPSTGTVVCDKPWKEIFVNQDGTIVPCCCGPDTGPVIGHLDDGLLNLWSGPRINDVRTPLAAGSFHEDCHCGINISAVARQSGPERFFTRLQRSNRNTKGVR
jgi:MoaA/NifB/PqqE/SkfB family radical SAM enzyme